MAEQSSQVKGVKMFTPVLFETRVPHGGFTIELQGKEESLGCAGDVYLVGHVESMKNVTLYDTSTSARKHLSGDVTTVLQDFLRLGIDDREQIVQFANQYGLLTEASQESKCSPYHEGQMMLRERLDAWQPLHEELTFTFRLVEAFRKKAQERVPIAQSQTEKQLLEDTRALGEPKFGGMYYSLPQPRIIAEVDYRHDASRPNYAKEGMLWAQRILNHRLQRGLSWALTWSDNQLVPVIAPRSLASFLWLELAHQASLDIPVAKCAWCEAWELGSRRSDWRYCDACRAKVPIIRKQLCRLEASGLAHERVLEEAGISMRQYAVAKTQYKQSNFAPR